MQALQLQFLDPQNVLVKESAGPKEKAGASSNSFKSMLDEAEAAKKTEATDTDRNSRSKDRDKDSEKIQNKVAQKAVIENTETVSSEAEVFAEDCAFEQEEAVTLFGQIVQASDCSISQPSQTENSEEVSELQIAPVSLQQVSFVQDMTVPAVEDEFSPELASLDSGIIETMEPVLQPALKEDSAVEETGEALAATADAMEAESALPVAESGKENLPKKPVAASEKSERGLLSSSAKAAKEDALSNPVFSVIDERGALSKQLGSSDEKDVRSLVAESVHRQGNTLEVAMNFADTAAQDILSTNGQTASADGSTFQQMLANQIQYSAPDFVKAGNIILKDADNGVINMNLKPESLGNVKISLQVSDKGIEGQITVASKEAFEAFKQNMDTLRQAFQQNGFENASLNLNLASNSDAGQFGQGQQQSSEPYFANKTFGNYAEGKDMPASSANAAAAYKNDGYHIDVVA